MREKDEMKSLLDELGRELHQTKADVGEQRKQCADLETQLEVRAREKEEREECVTYGEGGN